ncbi:DUF4129 domain-containing protein [Symbiobacterium terraclitae]|uniref:DUF4129 domain-containing protein n=1 Tax=Symbiobacterium terraclitae TaxID=557451 RepID=UPI0035B56F67
MRRALALLLLLLSLPAAPIAAAAVPATAYLEQLQAAEGLLGEAEASLARGDEAAARMAVRSAGQRLTGIDQVVSPAGEVRADLSDLQEALREAASDPTALGSAREVLEAHLRAAEELVAADAVEAPGARASLDRALAQVASQSLLQRARNWFLRLFLRGIDRAEPASFPVWAYWVGGAVGALALTWAGIGLYRALTGHGAGREGVWVGGRGTASARPPQPAELLQQAQAAAGRGEYLEGIRLAHLALLLHLDHLDLISYRPAQTNREHELQLRSRGPSLLPALRRLHDLVEECLYAGHPARADEYGQAESLVMQLWREGDAASRSQDATPGRSSPASSH